MAFEV